METLFIGKNTVRLREVGSTNSYAMELLKDVKCPEGTIIVAEKQVGGRGQRGSQWHTAAGENLTFSLILFPSFLTAENQFYLSRVCALACCQWLSDLQPGRQDDIGIKWPNDIYYRNKKMGGILIENTYQGAHLQTAILGIGLNINQVNFDPQLAPFASSLRIESGQTFPLDQLLERWCPYMEAWYLRLRAGKHKDIYDAYWNNLLFKNQLRPFKIHGQYCMAEITGVSPKGLLELQIAGRLEKTMADIKEVEFLRE